MKKYKLKQWYPTLAISWRTEDRYEYDADRQVMTNISNVKNGLAMPKEMVVKKQELHPDFWELIEQTDLLEEYLDVNTSDIDKRIGSIAIEALENIANPLNYLLEEAKKERRTLDAYIAGKLMENPYFYADIAEKALRLIKQTKAMQEELITKQAVSNERK